MTDHSRHALTGAALAENVLLLATRRARVVAIVRRSRNRAQERTLCGTSSRQMLRDDAIFRR